MCPLWGSTPAQNHQLPSGDYAVEQGMFFRAYQRHQRSTMRVEKGHAANGAQRNASTAKVHDLSYKRVPRDSFLTATRNSCNQTQTDPPTRSPNKMLHRKTAFTGVFFVHAQHLEQIPAPNPIQTNVPLQEVLNKRRMKSLGRWDLNTHVGGLFKKGKCPYQKDLYPYLSSRSLKILLISTLHQEDSHHLESKKSARDVSLRHLSSCRSSHHCHFASQRTTASAELCSARRPLYLRHLSTPNAHTPWLNVWTIKHSQRGGMVPQWTPSTPSWLAISSPMFPLQSVLVHYVVHFIGKIRIILESH